ncbi:MAG TPA: DUF1631 family protein [Pseudomonadales bacterium]|nr:DUF1631 family protein [Pseudomonadales bacterium]
MMGKVIDHPSRHGQDAHALLQRIHEVSCDFVRPLLDTLLPTVDDALFARADGLPDGRPRQQYLDGMRTLRLEREALKTRFWAALAVSGAFGRTRRAVDRVLDRNVDRSIDGNTDQNIDQNIDQEVDACASGRPLLADEALEQRLAVAAMTQRLERQCDPELTRLRGRIRALMEQDPACADLPLAWRPRHFAEAFATALEGMALTPEVRLLLFQLFERSVLARTAELYPRHDDLLRHAGVLPQATSGAVRDGIDEPASALAARDPHPPVPARPAPSPNPSAEHGRGALRELPGLRRKRRFAAPADTSAARAPAGPLLHVSDVTQRRLLPTLLAAGLDRLPARIDLAAALVADMHLAGMPPILTASQEDTINLMQMLFDELLRDDDLAVPMRALLARLQLPLVRVALVDATFITEREHHVRRFLDRLISAGTGWTQADERGQDRLFRIIAAIVDGLASADAAAFDADAALVREFDAELRAALDQEADGVRRLEAQAVAQEEARIEADRTRQLVERLIDHRAAMIDDEVLRAFLREDWRRVMVSAHRESCGRSSAWRDAFAALRGLTGATVADAGALHAALRSGLERITSPADAECTAARILERVTDGATHAPPGQQAPADLPAAPPEPASGTAARLPARAAVERADALGAGDWLELRVDTQRRVRGRLAAVTVPPERCILVDRRGGHIDTLSRMQLAEALESGRARPLDTHRLFDTALATVVDSLRTTQATA